MKIAIYGKPFNRKFFSSAERLLKKLQEIASEILIYKPLASFIKNEFDYQCKASSFFSAPFKNTNKPDLLLSLGGDGTFLDATVFVGKLDIPLAGINTGRLGFLANISEPEIEEALEKIIINKFSIEERILLKAKVGNRPLTNFPYCLNEITIQKISPDTIITISVYNKNQLLNNYWADGLIIATPTGSTAYSLSAGGPIMTPEAENIIIIPIAPHTLTIRPIIMHLEGGIKIKVKSRKGNFLCSADSRTEIISNSETIHIEKADFKLKTILLDGKNFFDTIRNKLMWGIDKRNF